MANVDAVQRSLLREIRKREDWMPIYEAFKHIMDNLDQQRDRSGGDVDLIADTEGAVVSHDGGNRTYRVFRDDIDALQGALIEAQKKSRQLEQRVFELSEVISKHSNQARRNEQLIAELTERLDSGT